MRSACCFCGCRSASCMSWASGCAGTSSASRATPCRPRNPRTWSACRIPIVSTSPVGFVYLVGAGPGHPGLITLRAVECLRQADLVLYDHLVPEAMLEHAPAHAERVPVTDLAPRHAE